MLCVIHSFSQGSTPTNPAKSSGIPLIYPHYLKSAIDVEALPTGVRITAKVFHAFPLKEKRKVSFLTSRHEYVRPWRRRSLYSGIVGQNSTQQEQQVWDVWWTKSLVVMGLERVTIVDASVLSLLVSGSIMAVVIYAVAENADSVLVPLVKEEAVSLSTQYQPNLSVLSLI